MVAPHLRQPGVVEGPDVEVADEGLPRRRAVEPGHAVHQGRFSRSGRSHHRREATALERDVDAGESMDRRLARPVGLGETDGVRRRRSRTLCCRCLFGERHAASFLRCQMDGGLHTASVTAPGPTVNPA